MRLFLHFFSILKLNFYYTSKSVKCVYACVSLDSITSINFKSAFAFFLCCFSFVCATEEEEEEERERERRRRKEQNTNNNNKKKTIQEPVTKNVNNTTKSKKKLKLKQQQQIDESNFCRSMLLKCVCAC